MISNMKTKNIFLILDLICVISIDSFAQELQEANNFGRGERESEATFRIVVDSLQQALFRCDSINQANMKLIDSLDRSAKFNSRRMDIIVDKRMDSLLNVISRKDKEIATLKANIGFVDTCMVKLANRWLYEPFNKEDVDEAITYFDRIYSTSLKKELSIVQELLQNYESSYREFQSILKQAQGDIDRESPFVCEDYKNKYTQRIESMSYYLKYYKGDWNIRYLNEQITEALERLKNHSDSKPADFVSLIDPNFNQSTNRMRNHYPNY